jgi:hypothetical protein
MTLGKPFLRNSQLFNKFALGSSMLNFTEVRRKPKKKYGLFIYAILQSTAFTAPVFKKHTTAQ